MQGLTGCSDQCSGFSNQLAIEAAHEYSWFFSLDVTKNRVRGMAMQYDEILNLNWYMCQGWVVASDYLKKELFYYYEDGSDGCKWSMSEN